MVSKRSGKRKNSVDEFFFVCFVVFKEFVKRSFYRKVLLFFNTKLKELSPKYRAKILLVALDPLHLRGDRDGSPLAQVLFVQNLCV